MGYIAVKTFLSPGYERKTCKNPHKHGNSDYTHGICSHKRDFTKIVQLMLWRMPPAY